MLNNLAFVAVLGLLFAVLLRWGFRNLAGEKWQILATLPLHKNDNGQWHGLNITAYGLITACSYVVSLTVVLILLGSLAVPLLYILPIALAILAAVIPASSIVARMVEGKSATFTVGGAAFVGIVLAPWIVTLANEILQLLAQPATAAISIPVMPTLAAFLIAYTFGEGIGRLACISFGCCYGKPLAQCGPLVQRMFKHNHFVFHGAIKKIAYEGKIHGQKVVPIQAVTCVAYIVSALIATFLFLQGAFVSALLLSLIATQGWRVLSETLRADYRGGGRISVYQILALVAIVYVGLVTLLIPANDAALPNIAMGLASIWNPWTILFLQAVGGLTFWNSGRSVVTRAEVSIHLCPEHI